METGEEPVKQKTSKVILHRTMQIPHKAEDFRSAYQLSPALKLIQLALEDSMLF